jgi:hypothetical protein
VTDGQAYRPHSSSVRAPGARGSVRDAVEAERARSGHYVRVKKSVAFDLRTFSGGTVPVTDRRLWAGAERRTAHPVAVGGPRLRH